MNPFIAIDWGTSNRRVFVLADGEVVRTERDALGTRAMAQRQWPAELRDVRDRFGDLPVLIAGMAGSSIGWVEVPYVAASADAAALARAATRIDTRTAIVPGVCVKGDRPDVMRGEETQLIGAATGELAPLNGLFAQPGTHNKWVVMRGGAVSDFRTVMTGELWALLRDHSILAPQLAEPVRLGAAFDRGVQDARACDLTARLFAVRAGTLLGQLEDAASYASGLLIGADVAAGCSWSEDAEVWILANEPHAALYSRALRIHQRRAHVVDSHAAFVAGACAIQERL